MGVRLIKISARFIVNLLADPEGWYSVCDDRCLPADVKLVSIWVDPSFEATLLAKLESDQWSEVLDGERIPFIEERTIERRPARFL